MPETKTRRPHAKTSMDSASYALWQELRAPCIQRLKPNVIYGSASCLLWLIAGLMFGNAGLLSLVLVWFALFLPIGGAHMLFGAAKDDWEERFTPSFYLAAPFIGSVLLFTQLLGVLSGKPFIPTILSGKNLASITRDVDGGAYRFTMTSGKHADIVIDKYDRQRFHLVSEKYGVVGDLTGVLMDLDDRFMEVASPPKK